MMPNKTILIPDYYPFNLISYSFPAAKLPTIKKPDKPISKTRLMNIKFPQTIIINKTKTPVLVYHPIKLLKYNFPKEYKSIGIQTNDKIKKDEKKIIILKNKFNLATTTNEIDHTLNIISRLVSEMDVDVKKITIREKLINNLLNYTKTQIPVPLLKDKTLITIDDEINDISDLLKVAKKYKDDNRYFTININILKDLIIPLEILESVIGMHRVKEQIVDQILSSLQSLYDEEQRFHTVIQGPPGVGKTMLAKIIGDVYIKMGILKNKTGKIKFTVARRSDLVGKFLGHTARLTQAMIDKSDGGVLFIDEVYSLGNSEKRDSYSKECIDTINLNLTEKKNFVCIIAGYAKDIEECFFAYNSGLKRRFPFVYEVNDYTSDEMCKIMVLKVKTCDWKLHEHVTTAWLVNFFNDNMEHFPHFGGDIETLLLNCKTVHGRRIFGKETSLRKILTKDDITLGFKKLIDNKKKSNDNDNNYTHMYV
jgi:hypothetical protein